MAAAAGRLLEAYRACGCTMNNPNMQLSLLGLAVDPRLRLTDLRLGRCREGRLRAGGRGVRTSTGRQDTAVRALPRRRKVRPDPRPLYQRAEEALVRRVSRMAAGEQLPAEPELAQRIGISRATLREAMRSLAQQGLLVRRRVSVRSSATGMLSSRTAWRSSKAWIRSDGGSGCTWK